VNGEEHLSLEPDGPAGAVDKWVRQFHQEQGVVLSEYFLGLGTRTRRRSRRSGLNPSLVSPGDRIMSTGLSPPNPFRNHPSEIFRRDYFECIRRSTPEVGTWGWAKAEDAIGRQKVAYADGSRSTQRAAMVMPRESPAPGTFFYSIILAILRVHSLVFNEM